jgi:anaerobic selenocysteine-containing dehydrogenase
MSSDSTPGGSTAVIETRRSFCRFCHAGCAIDVDVDVAANRVVAVHGVQDDPMYAGYTCIKGRHLGDQHHHDGRLKQSLQRAPGGFQPVGAATAFDDIADRVAALIDAHGPRSIATYCGTAAYQNATGLPVARSFHQAIGSTSFYTSSTIDQPAKFLAPMRHGAWLAGVHDFETADVAMVIGCNTLVSTYSFPGGLPSYNPLVRLRAAKARGLYLIVIDPRRTEMAGYADLHLAVRPGEDPTLLAGIIRQLFVDELVDHDFCSRWVEGIDELRAAVQPFTPDYVEQRAGVHADSVIEAARQFGRRDRGAVSTGTGPNMAPHSTLTEHLSMALNTLCGRYNREGDTLANPGGAMTPPTPLRAEPVRPPASILTKGAPARVRGLHTHRGEAPTSALADEILLDGEGQIRALFTLGGNPVVAWPDQRKTVQALGSLDLHVVLDAHLSATAKTAHYVIASTLSLERPDVPTTIDRWFPQAYTNYTPAVLATEGEVFQEWQVYTEVASRLGVTLKLPGGDIEPGQPVDADDVLDLIYAGAKVPLAQVREHGAQVHPDLATVVAPADPGCTSRLHVCPDGIADELADVRAETTSAEVLTGFDAERHRFRMTSRRLKSVFNSSGREVSTLRSKAGTNFAHMHPDDLSAVGIADGGTVELSSPRGTIRAVVKAAPDVRHGVISMAHAWGGLPDEPGLLSEQGSTTAALIDVDSGYDRFTGMPVMSAIPVEVRVVN